MDLLVMLVTEIAKYTVAPIERQLGYLYYYKRDINNLNMQIQNLEKKKTSIEGKVDEARTRGEVPTEEVLEWLTDMAEECKAANLFLGNEDHGKAQCGSCGNGSFPNLLLRRKLSKKARNMAPTIASIIEKADNLKDISKIPSLQNSFKNRDFEDFDSRKQTLEKIMKALKDPAHRMIGVYGAGGIGKTTLVKKVAEMALEEGLYSKVVMVTISQTFNISEKQKEIAEKLGIKMPEETEPARADRLKQVLREQRKVLIVLDDIWETKVPNLSEIGIDFKDEQIDCKILLVSRDQHVLCNCMDVNKNIELQFLSEREAMNLFQKYFRRPIESSFESLAREIVKECGGLPVAVVPIACALRNRDIYGWKDALNKLRSSPSEGHPKAYPSIRTSYDSIQSDQEKMIVLLCSLHEEDTNISVENLMSIHAAACNSFQDMETLEAVRYSVNTLVKRLIDRCLLLNGDSPGTVKMHDVIRDIMKSIASEDRGMYCFANFSKFEGCLKDGKLKDSTAISLLDRDFDRLPEELACPKLELLLVLDKVFAYRKQSMLIPDESFEAVKKLRALCMYSVSLDRCPRSLCSLQDLQTLYLQGCNLEDIVLIGELKNLVVLDLSNSNFKLLPEQIGKLTRLQQLNLSHCSSLQVIWPNVLSSLVRLEELYMDGVHIKWESGVLNGDQRSNASLTELKNLKQLRYLHLHIEDATSLPKDMFVGEMLESYHIVVGRYSMTPEFKTSSRVLDFQLLQSNLLCQEYGFQTLMKKSEVLCLNTLQCVDNIAPQLNVDGFPQLKSLTVTRIDGIRHIVGSCNSAFPNLETLNLDSLSNLEAIVYGRPTTEPFGKLRRMYVENCSKLKHLLTLRIGGSLRQLEHLKIKNCPNMEELIFIHEETEEREERSERNIFFPRLKYLELRSLQSLKRICAGDFMMKCEFLLRLRIEKCPELKTSVTNCTSARANEETEQPLFIEKIASPCLENLSIKCCNSLKYLLSCSATSSLLHLKSIEVDNCEAMEQIVMMANALPSDQVISISFPRLETVRLHNLENLKRLSSSDDTSIECPFLMTLHIQFCHKLATIAMTDENYQVEKRDSVYTQPLANKKVAVPNILNQPLQMSFRNLQKLIILNCDALVHLFPFSAVESLAQLKELKIEHCAAMEVVVTALKAPEEDQKGLSRLNDHVIIFPKLEYLWLSDLPKLKMFCEGDRIECFSLLALHISDCDSLRTFVAAQTAPHTLTVPVEQEDLQVNPQSLSHGKVVFPNLERLSLKGKWVNDIWWSQFLAALPFPKLKVFESDSPRDQTSFIPFDIHIPQNIEMINLAGIWVEKIWVHREIGSVEQHDHVTLTHLQWLMLCRIPKLMQLGPVEPDDGQLPQTLATLETPEVERHLRLKTVVISSSVSFPNLTFLAVHSCHRIINLLSSSAAKSLVRLQQMVINDCKQLREIVIGDKLEGEAESSSGIVFSRLQYITLHRLPSLKRFYGGDSNMEFPLLTKVIVSECPEMEIFSNGSTSTPKLHKVITKLKFNGPNTHLGLAKAEEEIWEGDLNASVRQNWENVHSYGTALQRLFPETNDWDSDEEHMAVYQEVQSSGGGTDSFLE